MGQKQGDSRQQVLRLLRGRTYEMPDLQSMLSSWPQDINPELERLRADVNIKLERCAALIRLIIALTVEFLVSFRRAEDFAR